MFEYRPLLKSIGIGVGDYLAYLSKGLDQYSGSYADGTIGYEKNITDDLNRFD